MIKNFVCRNYFIALIYFYFKFSIKITFTVRTVRQTFHDYNKRKLRFTDKKMCMKIKHVF